MSCAQCGLAMHAKVSARGGRFFAHDRRSATCTSAGETEEHRSLKRALASAAREAGCQAQLEVPAAHGGWRADVLVTAQGGQLTALEAQLSSASLDDVLARTRRYAADNVDVVWFTYRATRWLHYVPAARLYRPTAPHGPWTRTHPIVSSFSIESCAEVCDPQPPWHGPEHANWSFSEERDLPEFIADVLHKRLIARSADGPGTYYEEWATPEDVRAAADYDAAQTPSASTLPARGPGPAPPEAPAGGEPE
nr:competence protein CoiA family protein [Streptomyces spectabilis]